MKKRTIAIILGIVLVALIVSGALVGVALAKKFSQRSVSLAISPREFQPLPEQGILVASVVPKSPAAEAGLARGDIILSIDGEEVNNLMDLQEIIEGKEPGSQMQMSVLHGDDKRNLTVTLGERDETPFLGIVSCDPGFAGRDFLYRIHPGKGLPPWMGKGALVTKVAPNSPAEKAGFLEGDRIVSVEGDKVTADTDLAELIGKYEPGDTIKLEVLRDGKEEAEEISVILGENPEDEGKAYLGIQYAPAVKMDIERGRLPNEIPFPPFMLPGEEGRPFELPEGVTSAVLIGKVIAGSPAEKAGLAADDLITAVDGESIQALNPMDFVKIIQKHKPSDKITITVYRNGEEEPLEIQVTLGEDPEHTGQAYLGIEAKGFMKSDKSGDPDRKFHFEFKLPDWFYFEEKHSPDFPYDEGETGVET